MIQPLLNSLPNSAKHLADVAAGVVAVGTMAQLLPHVAAALSIVWLLIRIWESDTIRGFTGRPMTGKRDED